MGEKDKGCKYARGYYMYQVGGDSKKYPLNSNPDEHEDDVETLCLAIPLEAPHAVRLLVPVSAGCAVHAAPASLPLLGPILLCWRGCRLVQLGCGHYVLDDGAVDGELVGWRRGTLGSGLRHHRLEHFILGEGVRQLSAG